MVGSGRPALAGFKAVLENEPGSSLLANLADLTKFDRQFEPESQQYEPASQTNPPWLASKQNLLAAVHRCGGPTKPGP